MDWPAALDTALFRWGNGSLANPLFDWLMPFLSGNAAFAPLVAVAIFWLVTRGGSRGRLCVLFLALAVAVGDGLICTTLKDWIGRVRPGKVLEGARVLTGIGSSGSMPSSHAANMFAAATVLFVFYRRSIWWSLPLALGVSFSRVYVGVHYPSDVLVGAMLGVGYAVGTMFLANWAWRRWGQQWFPLWQGRMPRLLPPWRPAPPPPTPDPKLLDLHWLRMGYVLIAAVLLGRLAFLAGDSLQLSEDEAYQWLWSKHLDISYYSKPPMIAYAQFVGTSLWGDTEFGVRFLSPVIAAVLGVLLLHFIAREAGLPRTAFWFTLAANAVPMLAVGGTLLTVDPLSVLFWTAAMVSGWKALQHDSTRWWCWTGLWLGLGFLSKYVALFQWVCFAAFFALHPPARRQLRRPGPYLALAINLICTIPVLVWNARHDWITVTHLGERGGLDRAWSFTLQYAGEFLGAELGLLNPVWFVGMLWAAVAFWRERGSDPLRRYLFSMGAPLVIFYGLLSLRSRVLPNWIAPAVLPLLCLAAVHWTPWLTNGRRWPRTVFSMGLGLGLVSVLILHDTDLVGKVAGRYLPPRLDPQRRVVSWKKTAQLVGLKRQDLLGEGKPCFLLGDHYGLTSLVAFYLPEAKATVPRDPLVYCLLSGRPHNQFYFWPGYTNRVGQNALFFRETSDPAKPPPRSLEEQFTTITNLGLFDVRHQDRVFHQIQIYECRGLR